MEGELTIWLDLLTATPSAVAMTTSRNAKTCTPAWSRTLSSSLSRAYPPGNRIKNAKIIRSAWAMIMGGLLKNSAAPDPPGGPLSSTVVVSESANKGMPGVPVAPFMLMAKRPFAWCTLIRASRSSLFTAGTDGPEPQIMGCELDVVSRLAPLHSRQFVHIPRTTKLPLIMPESGKSVNLILSSCCGIVCPVEMRGLTVMPLLAAFGYTTNMSAFVMLEPKPKAPHDVRCAGRRKLTKRSLLEFEGTLMAKPKLPPTVEDAEAGSFCALVMVRSDSAVSAQLLNVGYIFVCDREAILASSGAVSCAGWFKC